MKDLNSSPKSSVELIYQNLKANKEKLQDDYKTIRTIVMTGCVVGFLSFISFWIIGGIVEHIVIPFLFGSFTGFIQKKTRQAIYSGIAACLVYGVFFLLGNFVFINNDYFLFYLLREKYIYVFFMIIYGIINHKSIKKIIFMTLGAFIACYIRYRLLPDIAGLMEPLSEYHQTQEKLPGIFPTLWHIGYIPVTKIINYTIFPTIFWYLVIIFESLGEKEMYRNYFRRLLEYNGRLDRKNYTITFILCMIIFIHINSGLSLQYTISAIGVFTYIKSVLYVFILVIFFIQIIKRLHDSNQNSWLSVLFFIPLANLYLMIISFKKGDTNDNAYGISLNIK